MARWFSVRGFWLALSSLGAACGSNGEAGAEAEELGAVEQAIYGGDAVPNNNTPFGSVVALLSDGEDCTALKLSATRFLTAAHCINSTKKDSFVDINNDLQIGAESNAVKVSQVYIHPSWVSDPDAAVGNSEHSYDIALIDAVTLTPSIPVASAPLIGNIGDGQIGQIGPDGFAGKFVGYGCNPVEQPGEEDEALDKQHAHFQAVSAATYGGSAALYAHEILAIESGSGRQGTCSGDSGGPLFHYSSTGGYQVVGVSSTGVNDAAGDNPVRSGFARVANVGRWLSNPHNNSAAFSGIGFIQHRNRRKCANVVSNTVGTQGRLVECEGYDPNIHAHLWDLMPISGTNFFKVRMGRNGANRCFAVPTGTTNVTLQGCTGGTELEWEKVAISGSDLLHYKIRNRRTSQFLTPNASGNLIVANASASGNDQWLFYR